MAQYIDFQPSDFFNTITWTGTGATNALTGVGFQPDFTWIKGRSVAYDHILQDAARGATYQLNSNNTDGQTNRTDELTSFDADGFTLGVDSTEGVVNNSGDTYVGWNWKMGTTTGISGGTITPTAYSFNATQKQSVIHYPGSDSNTEVPHGLGVAPGLIIIKKLNASGNDWRVYSQGTFTTTASNSLFLNETDASTSESERVTVVTSTTSSVATGGSINGSGNNYIAYCFASVPGYSKISTYTGNGNANGAFVHTGFRVGFVMTKRTNNTGPWMMFDDKRAGYNEANYIIYANTNATEDAGATPRIDLLSNGFKMRNADVDHNGDGSSYCYMAFAKYPFVSSNNVPTVAR